FAGLNDGAINEIDVLKLTDRLLNHTEQHVYLNPIDIATVIDLMGVLVKTQGIAPRTVTFKFKGQNYATTDEVYPTFSQTKTFCELLVNIANNLLAPRNQAGWNATRPS
ncbi:adhesion g protein-coupled receptor l2-like, partial [Plakobranchus ocellatus]